MSHAHAILRLPEVLHFRSLLHEIERQELSCNVIGGFDFHDVKWATPSGMASLAALARSITQDPDRTIEWIHVDQCRARRYFQDMDFFQKFSVHEDEDFERRDENLAFARLVRVDWEADSSAIARNLAKLVVEHGRPIYNDFFTCIEESVRNVIDHARQPGYALAQSSSERGGDRSYNIAICDYGRGIRSALADNPDLNNVESDEHALEIACRKGTSGITYRKSTGQDQTNFGIGLWQIDRIAETTHSRFIIGSGNAVRVRDAKGVRFEHIANWPGTSVEISLFLSGFRNLPFKPRGRRRLRFG